MKRPTFLGCLQIFAVFLAESRLRLQVLRLTSPISSVMDGAVSGERLNLASLACKSSMVLLAGTLLARLARLPPPLRSVCFCSLAPAITLASAIVLAEITWDLKAKVFAC